jgi:hypothetical protein
VSRGNDLLDDTVLDFASDIVDLARPSLVIGFIDAAHRDRRRNHADRSFEAVPNRIEHVENLFDGRSLRLTYGKGQPSSLADVIGPCG